MHSPTSLRLERIAVPSWHTPGAQGAAPGGHWIIYSGGVPVLRCEDEGYARRLLRAVEERLAQRDAG